MYFKKYSIFILEKNKKDKKDIEEAEIPNPELDEEMPLSCSKCGSLSLPCKCYTEDYYNAKLSQQTPKPSKTKKIK